MYKQCVREQASRRQRTLEQGLLEAMLQQDYEEISVSELCESMGVPRKSFYRYFDCKDGALYALIDHTLVDFGDDYLSKGWSKNTSFLTIAGRICDYWMEHKQLLDALERSGKSGLLVQRAMEWAMGLEHVPGFLQTSPPQLQDYGIQFVTCGIMTMMVQWHHGGYQVDREKMAQVMQRLVSRPLIDMLEWE